MQKHLHSLKIACNESIEKDLTNMIFATVPSSYLTFRIMFLYLLREVMITSACPLPKSTSSPQCKFVISTYHALNEPAKPLDSRCDPCGCP